jgi:hypothetical protein
MLRFEIPLITDGLRSWGTRFEGDAAVRPPAHRAHESGIRRTPRMRIAVSLLLSLLLLPPAISAQLPGTTPPTISTLDLSASSGDTLVFGNTVLQVNTASTQEELPGLGHKFELLGVMVRDTDPENALGNPGASGGGVGGNEGISADMVPGAVALAFRNLPPGITIAALDNQLGLKYYFIAPRTCGGGSPRVTLLVDSDGDGDTDFAVHGHVNPPVYTACVMNKWRYEDLADDLPRWEVTPGGAVPGVPVFPFVSWEALETAVTATFPNHKVRAGFLVDDSCSFFPAACGKAHYDLLTIENRTLEIWQDTVKN